jgi:hypothetical protein
MIDFLPVVSLLPNAGATEKWSNPPSLHHRASLSPPSILETPPRPTPYQLYSHHSVGITADIALFTQQYWDAASKIEYDSRLESIN